jgi:hypothetical protein
MRPYQFTNGQPGSMWIDLDHVLAISEPYELMDWKLSSEITLRYPEGVRVVDLVLAFRDKPLSLLLVGSYEKREGQYHALLLSWKNEPGFRT